MALNFLLPDENDELEIDEQIDNKDENTDENKDVEPDDKNLDNKDKETKSKSTNISDDFDFDEAEVYPAFAQQVLDELGIVDSETGKSYSAEELLEEKSFKGFIGLIKQIVNDTSEPVYPNNTVKQFAEFCQNGGDPISFMKQFVEAPTITNIESVDNQKKVVETYLRTTTKMSDEKIKKYIDRLVKDDELADEAKEHIELLNQLDEQKKKSFIEKQKSDALKKQQENEALIAKVKNLIHKGSVEDLGFTMSKTQRNSLDDFIYKTDSRGETQYQKAIKNTPNLELRIAYLLQNGLLDEEKITKFAKTANVKEIEDKLKVSFKRKDKSVGSRSNLDFLIPK